MKIKRRKSRIIKIGDIKIGGNNPIAVQSMAKTFTCDLSATIKEIRQLSTAGCQIVRLAIRNNKDASAIKKIKQQVAIPLIADIHFDKNLAIKAIDNGADKIRLNPGNIYKKDEIKEIAQAAEQACIPIRVGVNSGSVIRHRLSAVRHPRNLVQIMVNCTLNYIKLLEGFGFYDTVVSIKGSDVFTTIQANERIAKLCDYPLHLGITATGPGSIGIIKSAMVIGRLLSEGIGDTIRISLTDRAVQEVKTAYHILEALGLENSRPEIISCPTCGRCEVDLVSIVKNLEKRLNSVNYRPSTAKAKSLKVAVMGCVVNGPGESRAADLGIAFGKKEGLFFKKGKPIKKVPFHKCIDTLLNELNIHKL